MRWLGVNAADVEQVAEARPEFVGVGSGMPHQELGLVHDSVVPGSLVVEVEEHGRWVRWEVVDTLAASGRTDRHVVLDAPAGRIHCGDSARGRTFGIGDRIRAVRYRYGGGRAGNVAAKAIKDISGQDGVSGLRVENPLPTVGGEDAETITRALERIPGELTRHDRAVTAGDFQELARIPGVGRAECLPLFDPRTRSTDPATGRFNAAGVVSVLVWPAEDPRHPDAPLPDTALLRAVCERLDARRLVTTELYVVPPTYHPVAVSVGLAVRAGYSAIGVRRWAELVLRQYLAPLPPYGPEGRGWPLGHRVHGPELEAAVVQVEGVDFVEGLEVADLAGGTPQVGSVELDGLGGSGADRAQRRRRPAAAAGQRGAAPGGADPGAGACPEGRVLMAAALTAAPRGATSESGTARTFAPIATNDQWLRCAHTGTALDAVAEEVVLASSDPGGVTWPIAEGPVPRFEPAGLAFDPRGCLYHGDPERAQAQRVAWRPVDLSVTGAGHLPAVGLLAGTAEPPAGTTGQFHAAAAAAGLAPRPVALAADPDEHLFVLDGASGLIHVLDLADGHLVRTIELALTPVDLAADGRTIVVATADRACPLVEVTALGLPAITQVPENVIGVLAGLPGAAAPARVAVGPHGERWLLLRDPAGADAWAVPVADERRTAALNVAGATDIELDGQSRLVVAGPAGALLRRFTFAAEVDTEDAPLRARRFDGRGIVRTPDGGIGFWMSGVPTGVSGFRLAVAARRRYAPAGRVDGFRLDGGAYQQQWGRCFVEACIPEGTDVRLAFVTADDEPDPLEPEGPSIPRTLPANVEADVTPVPPAVPPLVAQGRLADLADTWALHRRGTGSELPWVGRDAADRFEVYEVPVQAPPGRYLWVRLELTGTTAATPRIRAVRVEVPGHDLLQRLPRAYRSDPDAASFLHRYLGMADGLLTEMQARSARRDLMLDPHGAPTEVLPWLASLVGLTLDERWPEASRRTMLAEAVCLFRRRGTIAGLRRMLEIYLGTRVVIVEAFRFRGVESALGGGGGAAGGEPRGAAAAVVGFGLRVGGEPGDGEPPAGHVADAYQTHAHRFTVLVPRDLDTDQLATVQSLLDLHRPAHTLVDVCTVGRGMRVGIGLHLAVSTLVGPSAGFHEAVVGEATLGPGTVVGRPRAGVRPGGSHLGTDTVVDP